MKEKLAWKNAEKQGKQRVSKGSIRESVIGNRKKLEKVSRKEKLAWQNKEKHGKKTAEAKGKQNEYKGVYRQQKQAGESAEERETRLAKRREAWQERTAEAKGKQKEYKRVYDLDKMQNETEEERTNRKQDQATETVDE